MISAASRVVRLVNKQSDRDIVAHLSELLEEAKDGKIVGLIATAHYGSDDFAYVGSGSFCRHPHLAATAIGNLMAKFFPR